MGNEAKVKVKHIKTSLIFKHIIPFCSPIYKGGLWKCLRQLFLRPAPYLEANPLLSAPAYRNATAQIARRHAQVLSLSPSPSPAAPPAQMKNKNWVQAEVRRGGKCLTARFWPQWAHMAWSAKGPRLQPKVLIAIKLKAHAVRCRNSIWRCPWTVFGRRGRPTHRLDGARSTLISPPDNGLRAEHPALICLSWPAPF